MTPEEAAFVVIKTDADLKIANGKIQMLTEERDYLKELVSAITKETNDDA